MRKDILLPAWLLVMVSAVGCHDTTRPNVSGALTGEWDFDIAFAAAGDSTCHLQGAMNVHETASALGGSLTSYIGECGVLATGTISAASRRGQDVAIAVGGCSYVGEVVGTAADSLLGSATCGTATATWTAARVGPAATIALSLGDSALLVGDHLLYTVAIADARHHPLFGRTPAWSTRDAATATVTPAGLVTALAPGVTTVIADAEGLQDSASVEVVQGYYTAIAAGDYQTCALTPAGIAYCWGGTGTLTTVPTPVPGGVPFRSITAGYPQACGLTSDGVAYCWQGGVAAAPAAIGFAFKSLTAGRGYVCGLTTEGAAWCWTYDSVGDNYWGQLGSGSTTYSRTPVPVTGGLSFTALAAEGNHTCGVTTSGSIYCWGANWHGELGNGTQDMDPHPAPSRVPGTQTFVAVAAGFFSTCGVTSEGRTFCWGGCLGEIGNGTDVNSSVPVEVAGALRFQSLAGHYYHFCGLSRGDAACWGSNDDGQLGDGMTDTVRTVPGSVLGGLSFRQLAAGSFHTCGVTSRGVAYCWGWNLQGQLGDGTQVERDVPTRVSGQSP